MIYSRTILFRAMICLIVLLLVLFQSPALAVSADEDKDAKLIEVSLLAGYLKAQADQSKEDFNRGLMGQDGYLLVRLMANSQIKIYNQLVNETFTNQTKLEKLRLPEISV